MNGDGVKKINGRNFHVGKGKQKKERRVKESNGKRLVVVSCRSFPFSPLLSVTFRLAFYFFDFVDDQGFKAAFVGHVAGDFNQF